MKEESSFEHFIREKVHHLRMQPSENVWHAIQSSLTETYVPRFHTTLILFWGILFLNIYTPLGEMPVNKYFIPADISGYPLNETAAPNQTNKSTAALFEGKKKIKFLHKHDEGSFDLPLNDRLISQSKVSVTPEWTSKDLNDQPSFDVYPLYESTDKTEKINQKDNATADETTSGIYKKPSEIFISGSSPSSSVTDNSKEERFFERLKQKLKLADRRNGLQFYFTPSLSYRVLYIENKPYFNNDGRSPESSVSHYPSAGLEAGVALLHKVSKRWRFRGGIQMNFSRYNINATNSTPELVYVTLSQEAGFERNTNIRNGGGMIPKKLMNENLQVSMPFGMEFMALGNEKVSFNIAGTLQPSVSLYAGGYMVTTNYKNYISADNIFRRYNVQTGIECFIKTNLGLIDVQLGPQIRYQLLSNTLGSYPIKEHLIDYGFKFGIVKRIQ